MERGSRLSNQVLSAYEPQEPNSGMSNASNIHGASHRALARVILTQRMPLAESLLESIHHWDKYSQHLPGHDGGRREFVDRELVAFIDYLRLFFETGDTDYRHLYIGEKLKQCLDPHDNSRTRERRKQITESDRRALVRTLTPLLSAPELDLLTRTLDTIDAVVTGESTRKARVLFIGDCLHLDVVSFLTAPLLERGFELVPTFATSKNPMELHRGLSGFQPDAFDLIFYSPFTYEFQPDYSGLQFLRTTGLSRRKITRIADAAIADTQNTLDLLGRVFEVPIFVHNSANIRRHDGTMAERLKNLLTAPARRKGREIINAWLPTNLERRNESSFRHFFVLDEFALLNSGAEDRLGEYFYNSDLQHPAVLGKAVAPLYETAIVASMQLARRKVVVCDLDNTLWRGVIGEETVSHYEQRQRILLALRKKGVLLAINSKNDPKNVNWTGAVLTPDDFVCSQINWRQKTENLQAIASELNLKLKDFVFIDDRPDERAIVGEFLPEVLTLDPDSAEVWRQLELVAHMLPEQSETDRTLAYKQREQRERFLNPEQENFAREELFRKLELSLSIRPAEIKELQRVVELINRTNQFNMRGSRTTLKEITKWHNDRAYVVLVTEAGDRFGSMGVISVIVLALAATAVEIPIFVLSCRVFGYGVETAILNFVKRLAREAGNDRSKSVVGYLTQTPSNEPCRMVYLENGFEQEGDVWTFRHDAVIPDPEWLKVSSIYPKIPIPARV